MTLPDPSAEMLSELSQCAYRLGVRYAAEAERAEEGQRQLDYFNLFDRCFFSVRVAIGLQLRLRRAEPAAQPAFRPEAPERADWREPGDPPEREAETDPSGRDPVERDRDREVERASLPMFLKTLQGVAADAAALPGPAPAALPTLTELLSRITATPAPVAAPRTPAAGLKARLAGSATAPALTLTRPPSQPGLGPPLRRATGPPRR